MNQEKIEQYVAGKMDEAEAEAFEEYCVANPDFAKQVEFEQRLKSGIKLVAQGSTEEFVRSNNPMRWRLAASAAVLLALSVGFFAWHTNPAGARPVLASIAGETQLKGPSMRLALVRGAEAAPALQHGLVRVEIVGLFDTDVHYSVSLDRLDPRKSIETMAALHGQHPTSPMTLEVMLDSEQLKPGAYSLRVRKQSSDEEALDFGFVKY
jgi:hypothetical protein